MHRYHLLEDILHCPAKPAYRLVAVDFPGRSGAVAFVMANEENSNAPTPVALAPGMKLVVSDPTESPMLRGIRRGSIATFILREGGSPHVAFPEELHFEKDQRVLMLRALPRGFAVYVSQEGFDGKGSFAGNAARETEPLPAA